MTGRSPVRVRGLRCSLCGAFLLEVASIAACAMCDALLVWPRMAA